ncbi:ribonuclease H-like domain-containing protein [Xylariaceae sp. FL0804]|nr:ribonuclease H-like domain-containing protein [Xylariaceae sp. FL0804]
MISSPKPSLATPIMVAVIHDPAGLQVFVANISPGSTLFVDLEGQSLGRHGTITHITIMDWSSPVHYTIFVIDVQRLKELAFTTIDKNGKSLKKIFEDPGITKYFWDVRNDADALWAHYGVGLKGVIDIQLLENASRPGYNKDFVRGLKSAVQSDIELGAAEKSRWVRTKEQVTRQMSDNVFVTRPRDTEILQYCRDDVVHLPALRDVYMKRIKEDWLEKAKRESANRVQVAQSPDYDPRSPKKAEGPWARWQRN